jgi:hypothetical protein
VRHRRLQVDQVGGVHELRLELRALAPDLPRRRLEVLARGREHQHPGGRVREVELIQLTEVTERLRMQLGHHRIEGMLYRARVPPGRGGPDHVALVQLYLGAGLRQEGGGGAAHDAAADDRDVGRCAHSPLA